MPIRRRRNLGGDILLKKTITLTDADIKALPTAWSSNNAFPIIAPTEPTLDYITNPTKLFIPILGIIVLDTSAGAYTNLDAGFADLRLAWGRDWSFSVAQFSGSQNIIGAMVGNSATYTLKTITANAIFGQANKQFAGAFFPTIHDGSNAGAFLKDNGLYIISDNGALGAYTGGNAANTMKVTVWYDTIDF